MTQRTQGLVLVLATTSLGHQLEGLTTGQLIMIIAFGLALLCIIASLLLALFLITWSLVMGVIALVRLFVTSLQRARRSLSLENAP